MKFVQGISSSATDPATYSLATDYFPEGMRTTVNSILTAGPYLGAGLAAMHISLIQWAGWRFVLNFIGTSGLLISLYSLLVLEEPR